MPEEIVNYNEYNEWLNEIKSKIRSTQLKAIITVNHTLIELYWNIGRQIAEKQERSNWGASIVEKLAKDLKAEFPDISGFASRSLFAMKQFYQFYRNNSEIVPQVVAQIPWGHNRLKISKIKDINTALFYVQSTIENNWSRNVLEYQIETKIHERKGKAINNFETTLPAPQSDLASETLKDPYIFDFLALENNIQELEIERQLITHITNFLLELGAGFSFVGRQYKIEVGQKDYFIDLLFYHYKLRCFVVIELKGSDFKPEYAGKMNFYLSAIDDTLKGEHDNPTIGIILCKSKDKIEVEYALRDINKPIGVSNFQLTGIIPPNLRSSLPTVEQFEKELAEKML